MGEAGIGEKSPIRKVIERVGFWRQVAATRPSGGMMVSTPQLDQLVKDLEAIEKEEDRLYFEHMEEAELR